MQVVPSFVRFTIENTVIDEPVMYTNSENLSPISAAARCIPVTIYIFAQKDRITEYVSQAIVMGIMKAAEVTASTPK